MATSYINSVDFFTHGVEEKSYIPRDQCGAGIPAPPNTLVSFLFFHAVPFIVEV